MGLMNLFKQDHEHRVLKIINKLQEMVSKNNEIYMEVKSYETVWLEKFFKIHDSEKKEQQKANLIKYFDYIIYNINEIKKSLEMLYHVFKDDEKEDMILINLFNALKMNTKEIGKIINKNEKHLIVIDERNLKEINNTEEKIKKGLTDLEDTIKHGIVVFTHLESCFLIVEKTFEKLLNQKKVDLETVQVINIKEIELKENISHHLKNFNEYIGFLHKMLQLEKKICDIILEDNNKIDYEIHHIEGDGKITVENIDRLQNEEKNMEHVFNQ